MSHERLRADLVRVLGRSRELGFLGDGPLEPHIENARLYLELLDLTGPGRASEAATESDDALRGSSTDGTSCRAVLDLGSGGGVPGLVIACLRPDRPITLLDSQRRRCAFLQWAVDELALGHAVVAHGRAESLGHEPRLRHAFSTVVARSFGPPPVTAECAVGFLRTGGNLLVSEPPRSSVEERWPAEGLRKVGLVLGRRTRGRAGTVQELVVERANEMLPRRTGVPSKRPLF